MRAGAAPALALCALAAVGCASRPGVLRVVDGRLVEGRFVEPEAYAAFLRGAIAEEHGDLRAALEAYARASDEDGADPQIWTRLGEVRCRIDPKDSAADAAFERALALDAEWGASHAARSRCETLRGNVARAREEAALAARDDPWTTEHHVLLSRAERASGAAEASSARVLALTLDRAESAAAWEALAGYASVRGDTALYVRALSELARRAPTQRAEIARMAVGLAGAGELLAAASLAGVLVDARDHAPGGPSVLATSHPLLARLAVDDALARGDVEAARRRATQTHVGLEETAGRALLVLPARPEIARAIAEEVAASDPGSLAARLVLASVLDDGPALTRAIDAPGLRVTPVPAAVAVAFGAHALRWLPAVEARAVVSGVQLDPIAVGDVRVVTAAVDLAAAGALADVPLTLEGEIELAARRRAGPPAASLERGAKVGLRHEYVARAFAAPEGARTLELARRLDRRRSVDPLVAVAWARRALAGGASPDGAEARAVFDVAPGDPLVAAAALELAAKVADPSLAARARAALSARARTPAERSLAGM